MRVPTPQDFVKAAGAQTEAILALPGLLIQLTTQVRMLTETLTGLNTLVAHVDQVLTDVEPGLRKLGQVLENPAIETIPDTLREINDNILPTLLKLKTLLDSSARFPGASLITGRRASP
jgi:hypothetical protein